MVREQILNGEFLPAEEIEKSLSPPGWEGNPVVCNHPMDKGGDSINDRQNDYKILYQNAKPRYNGRF